MEELVAALFVILFIFGWNQYLWPLLMTTQEGMYTIVLGIKRMTAAAEAATNWNLVMATAMAAGGHRGPDAALVHQGPRRAGKMSGVRGRRLRLAVLLGTAVLLGAGCAADMDKQAAEKAAESVPRPEWRLGDRWVFRRTAPDGTSAIVTHQVVAASPDGYTVRVLGLAAEVTRQWTTDLHLVQEALGDGRTARFEPPASYFTWPISPAKTWDQEFQYTDGRSDGRYGNTWKVGAGVEPIDTVAGRFYALPRGALGRAASGSRRTGTTPEFGTGCGWRTICAGTRRNWWSSGRGARPDRRGAAGAPARAGAIRVGPTVTGGASPGAGRPAICAHRGGASLWPNSLAAFRGALGLGVDLVECDVHQTRDGEVLVVHDPTLERTTTGRGAVRDVAWADLAAVTVGGPPGSRSPGSRRCSR